MEIGSELWIDEQYVRTEQYIVGAILKDSRCLEDVRAKVRPEMFLDIEYRTIFDAACQLQDEGKTVDIVTIGNRIKKSGGRMSGEVVGELTYAAGFATDTLAYCDILANEFIRQELMRRLSSWVADLSTGSDPRTVALMISEQTKELTEGTAPKGVSLQESVADLLSQIQEIQEGKSVPTIKSGYRDLDKILGGGFQRNGLYILAARPGKGKTTMALNIAKKIAKRGSKVMFVSLEMDRDQLSARIVASDIGGISPTAVLNATFPKEKLDDITETAIRTEGLPIIFNAEKSLDVKEIRLLAKTCKPDFVVIDYLGLITNENERGGIYEETTKKSKQLKLVARELGCPVLCLAQMNRDSEKRDKKKPMLSDLRDSGSIEQDADAVMFIWVENDKEDFELPEDALSDPIDLKLVIAKNRHGRIGIVPMYWDKLSGKITELQKAGESGWTGRIPF